VLSLQRERARNERLDRTAQHIAALLEQLGRIAGLDDRSCPFCGHLHTSSEELRAAAALAATSCRWNGSRFDRALQLELRTARHLGTARDRTSDVRPSQLPSLQRQRRHCEALRPASKPFRAGCRIAYRRWMRLLSSRRTYKRRRERGRRLPRWKDVLERLGLLLQRSRLSKASFCTNVERRLATVGARPIGSEPSPEAIAIAEADAVAAEALVRDHLAFGSASATLLAPRRKRLGQPTAT